MVDEQNTSEEEYSFGEEDTTDIYGGAVAESEGSPVRNVIFIIIGLVVVALVVYKLLGVFLGGKPKPQQAMIKPPVITQPIVARPAPIEAKTPVVAADEAQIKKIETSITQINAHAQSNEAEISKMDQRVTAMQATIADMAAKLQSIDQGVQALSQRLKPRKVAPSIKRLVKRRPKPPKKPYIRRTMYHIQAIIPGRAWLKGVNGSTLTVSRGSKLPGYGVVQDINPKYGRVTTSSGVVITYSPGDS